MKKREIDYMNVLIFQDGSLKKYNTLRLEAKAKNLYLPLNVDGIIETLEFAKGRKLVVLGNGSNVLFAQDYYDDSYVFLITTMMNDMDVVDNEIVVDAGVSFHDLAWFAMDHQIGGYEFTEDIPGTVGGALIMNAGQWQWTIGQYVHWIDVVNRDTGKLQRLIPDDNFFQYRYTKLMEMNVIVARAGLNIQPGEYNDVFFRMLDFKKERYMKQPRNYPNAGSVFKRPTKDGETYFVWKLFDEVNLRGYQVGGAKVSEKHPGFIVNVDHASVDDCLNLIQECTVRVKNHFDIDLHLEWRVIK